MQRRDRFDRVVLETTGLANPGPVAQTFFVDEAVSKDFALDGIVTLVDARHIGQHLTENEEAREQIAFADVLVLNKTDMVSDAEVPDLERRLQTMNGMAKLVRSQRAAVPMEKILGIGGFDLARALEHKPTLLEPEYPFEWAAAFELDPGDYELIAGDGPDPAMTAVFCEAYLPDAEDLTKAAEHIFRWFTEDPRAVSPSDRIQPTQRAIRLDLSHSGTKRFRITVAKRGTYWLFTEHLAQEFALELQPVLGMPRAPKVIREFAAGHSHDDAVTSFALESERPLDPQRFQQWLGRELQANGPNLYRLKGFLNLDGNPDRIVLQGVHMLLDHASLGPWGARPRRTQLVFIGKNLDRAELATGFEWCLV